MDAGLNDLRRAAQREPLDAHAHARLALALERAGMVAEAGAPADLAGDLAPEHEPLQLRLGEWRCAGRNATRNPVAEAWPSPREGRVEVRWRTPLPRAGAPVISDGRVFVGTQDGAVHALDLATGHRMWSQTLASGTTDITTPAVHSGRVIVGARTPGALHALDAATGALRWTVSGPAVPGGRTELQPLVSRGVVVAAWETAIAAFDLRTGAARWRFPTRQAGPVSVLDGIVVTTAGGVGDRRHGVAALELTTGAVRWQELRGPFPDGEIDDQCIYRTIVTADPGGGSRCFLSSQEDGCSHDLATGRLLYLDGGTMTRADECLAVTRAAHIVAIDAALEAIPTAAQDDTWEYLWQLDGDARVWTTGPRVLGDVVLSVTRDRTARRLRGVDARTGAVLYERPWPYDEPMALAPGLVVGLEGSSVFAASLR